LGAIALTAKSEHLRLDSLAVSPSARGLGVGSQLLEFDTKIMLMVGRRRVNGNYLALCWNELDIRRGTPVAITVGEGPTRNDAEERRALVAMVDYFPSMTVPESPKSRRRRRFSFGGH
jgi:GNAT superfamily N-acetyltransferase